MSEQSKIQRVSPRLRELEALAFPKRCACCAREYATATEFIAATLALPSDCRGLKLSQDDDGNPIVELFRNCDCGSTLMESFILVAT